MATAAPYSSNSLPVPPTGFDSGRATSQKPLDADQRPSTVDADTPWIGTFNFEDGRHASQNPPSTSKPQMPPTNQNAPSAKPVRQMPYHLSESSSSEHDLEKHKDEPGDDKSNEQDEQQEEKDPNVVDFDGPDDPYHPMNWPSKKKWIYATVTGMMTLVVTFASSIFSTAVEDTSLEFGVSTEVMTLGTSLFVLGFAFGPLIWGPLSELYGRRLPLFTGYFIFGIFQIPVGVAQNLQTIFVCRFFGGVFASAPLAVVGGLLADFFEPVTRGLAVCVFSAATFIGPITGPIVGGFVSQSYLGWRWTAWLTMIMCYLFGGIGFFVLPESYAPVLLQRKAKRLRFETRNWALHAKSEEKPVDFKVILETYLERPFKMAVLEPILLLITIYMSFIYGLLYLFFEAYPVSFQEQRGYNLGVGALPFISIGLGVVLGASIITYTTLTRFKRKYIEFGHVVPEERLIPMMIGSVFLPIGLFWFAWTSSPSISPWPQILSGIPIGAGVQMIFLQGLNYIIDVYTVHANSALTANTFMRSWVGAGFPMFAMGMYSNLGVPWATSTLGFIAVGLIPVPVLFFIYGYKIRKLSRYSPTD